MPLHKGWHPICLSVPQEVWSHKKDEVTSDGTLLPKAGPTTSPRQKKPNRNTK